MASLGHALLVAATVAAQESWEGSEATSLLSTRSMLTMHSGLEACVSVANRVSFASYVSEHDRDYAPGSDEYSMRQSLFDLRQKDVLSHNCQPSRSWSAGINHLTDRTDEERGRLFGWKHPDVSSSGGMSLLQEQTQERKGDVDSVANTFLPQVNWNLTATTIAKDQGSCGSCWAVATTNMLEAHWEIYNAGAHKLKLPMQDFVDCVDNPNKCGGTGGCEGAIVELALDYFLQNKMNAAANNAYTGSDPPNKNHCNPQAGGISAAEYGLATYETLPRNKALPVLLALQNGPVAVALYAGSSLFHYSNGITDAGCQKGATGTNINHAVLLSGYGFEETAGVKNYYWKIVNSWGARWGEQGSFRLVRQNTTEREQEHCATDTKPHDGVDCEGGPSAISSTAHVEVCGTCGILYDVVAIEFNKTAVLKLADDGFAKQI